MNLKDYAKHDFLKKQYKHKSIIGTIIFGLVMFALISGVVTLFYQSVPKQERVECNSLVAQAKDYRGFYITEEEKTMCDSHNIAIDAPVYNPNDCVNGVSEEAPRCQYPEEWFNEVY